MCTIKNMYLGRGYIVSINEYIECQDTRECKIDIAI